MSFKGSKTEDQKDEALPARRPPITRQTPALRETGGLKTSCYGMHLARK